MAVPRRPTRLSLLGWSSIDRAERQARCLRPPGPWRCAERARGRPTGSHPRRPPRAVHRNRDTMGCTGRPGQCRVRRRAHRVPAGANRRWAVGVRVNAASLSEPTHSLAGNSPNRAGSGRDGGMMRISLPLHRLSIGTHPAYAEQQLVLIGQPRPIRIPEERWLSWLDNPGVVARFESRRYSRADDLCWFWMAAVSSTGHGSFRAASLPGPTRRGTVPAHLFAYQLEHGVIPRLGWSSAEDAVICTSAISPGAPTPHICDWAPTPPTGLSI
jgi:hypothetical protein